MAYSAPVWAPGAGQVGGEGRTQWAPPLARLGIFFLDECDEMRRMRCWRPALVEGPAPAATAGGGGMGQMAANSHGATPCHRHRRRRCHRLGTIDPKW